MELNQLGDFISDPRNPLNLPLKIHEVMKKDNFDLSGDLSDVSFCFTVDVEHDFGCVDHLGRYETLKKGITNLTNLLHRKNIKATFFVGGLLAKENKWVLGHIKSAGHEVGLHGFNHEVWGDVKWWLDDGRILSENEKRSYLTTASEIFKDQVSEKPKLFRAPYLVVNDETLCLLEEFKFTVDSSAPAYYGVRPIYQQPKGVKILEIPVSADIKPQFNLTPMPRIKYPFMDTEQLAIDGVEKNLKRIKRILSYQIADKIRPHIVFLAHQWEFVDRKEKPPFASYAGEKNIELIEKLVNGLTNLFDVQYCGIENFSKKVT